MKGFLILISFLTITFLGCVGCNPTPQNNASKQVQKQDSVVNQHASINSVKDYFIFQNWEFPLSLNNFNDSLTILDHDSLLNSVSPKISTLIYNDINKIKELYKNTQTIKEYLFTLFNDNRVREESAWAVFRPVIHIYEKYGVNEQKGKIDIFFGIGVRSFELNKYYPKDTITPHCEDCAFTKESKKIILKKNYLFLTLNKNKDSLVFYQWLD